MKKNKIFNIILSVAASAVMLASCKGSLDPMPNGHYTDENLDNYPSLLKGFVDKAYALSKTEHYLTNRAAYLDCAAGMGMFRTVNANMRLYSQNAISPSSDPFESYWTNNYQSIYYINRYLKNNKGYNTQYLVDQLNDKLLRKDYQGDAYALRAWLEYDLLLTFGGKDKDGNALGYVIIDDYFDQSAVEPSSFVRGSYDECVEQILEDCDSALVYLPLANRDWAVPSENLNIEGGMRWGRFDAISVKALKAMTYLLWASDAYNPTGDTERWKKAAEYAAEAIDFKIENDFPKAGVTTESALSWFDPNTPEAYLVWRIHDKTSTYEANFYPAGLRGSATFGPTQEFVDMFPMANGYPITDKRSGYDAQNPYEGRDPRFYATIFHNGSQSVKSNGTVNYTFETFKGGKDENGNINTSPTNYYVRKFVYTGWNPNDQTVETQPHANIPISWREICLTFAEAANRAVGANVKIGGYTAKEVLGFLRNRTTILGAPGLGVNGDPYLEECAGNKDKFEALVKNERAIELCYEGKYMHDLARWNTPLSEINKPYHMVSITAKPDGSYSYNYSSEILTLALPSFYLPVPYKDMQRASGLVQNEGWSTWVANK